MLIKIKNTDCPTNPIRERAFTLMELLVVIAIIGILVGITVPTVKNLTKSNDQSQAVNLIRAFISSARGIAVSQHRMAGVVFFEETGQYSRPVNSGQTAMQLFVEDYNQNYPTIVNGATVFVTYSSQRQYLPSNIKLAALNEGGGTFTGENTSTAAARAILFDSNGQLLLRSGLATPIPAGAPGTYPQAYGDWNFIFPDFKTVAGVAGNAFSSPGFFIYNKSDYDDQGLNQSSATDLARAAWIRQNSDVVTVNGFTGGVISR